MKLRLATPLSALAWFLLAPLVAGQAKVAFTVTDEPRVGGPAGSWSVECRITGLAPEAGVVGFTSADWGWPRGWAYLEVLASEPPLLELRDDGAQILLGELAQGDTEARTVYRVKVTERDSERHRQAGLVPTRAGGYALGYSHNVLLRPTLGGEPLEADVEIELVASGGGTIVTGWGGRSQGRQRVSPDTPWGNGPIVFGEPATAAKSRAGAFEVECFQYTGPDATAFVSELVCTLAPAMARCTNWPARSPARIFLTDALGGGMGSDHGLHISVPADARSGHERDTFFITTVAHELFHDWLGIRLHESRGSLVWFREGFTEYFSQWFSASTGLIPRETFAETLEGYDRFARSSTSLGHVAFADPRVDWRDGDGPNELMAYRGAPVLALALDVELRAAGHAGLLQLIRDFLARDEHVFPPEDLRAWFVDYGLEERWNASIAGLEVPWVVDSLRRAGFEPTEVPVDVAYLGLQTVEEKPIWRVLGVDPEGPAGKAGVKVGDIIDGFFPFTGTPTPLKRLDTPYTFGLDLFQPGIEGSFLGLRREGEPLRIFVHPELRPWGLRTTWKATEATDAFFAFEIEDSLDR